MHQYKDRDGEEDRQPDVCNRNGGSVWLEVEESNPKLFRRPQMMGKAQEEVEAMRSSLISPRISRCQVDQFALFTNPPLAGAASSFQYWDRECNCWFFFICYIT